MNLTKRKFLFCPHCQRETWATPVIRFNYSCTDCGRDIDLIASKRRQSRERKQARSIKAKVLELPKSEARARRELDSEYIGWVKSLGCHICGKPMPDAHHVKRRSQGGSDRTCVPLCHEHHMELHAIGVVTFEDKHDIDLEELVKTLNRKYDERPKD